VTTLISQPQRILLLIDDNPADRQLVKRYLQRDREHDYVFVEAETGERGLKQCLAEPPDCILIDYDLPDISGLELLTELTGTSERTIFPIVIMTGVGNEMVAVQSMQRGAQEYLIKNNITPETLLITVDNAIKKVHMRLRVEAQQQHLHEQNKELQQRQQEIHALNIRLQRSMTESHHRIKNNLQTLASLVNMYTMDNPEMVPVSALKRLEQHIQTLASLHDLLTQEAKTDADFDTINLKASGHDIPLSATGDVLRVDLGLDSRFPNGRPIPYGAAPNKEQADVTDVLLSVLLSKGTVAVSDGAQSNDKPFQKQFPYLAVPHEGFQEGHGKAAP